MRSSAGLGPVWIASRDRCEQLIVVVEAPVQVLSGVCFERPSNNRELDETDREAMNESLATGLDDPLVKLAIQSSDLVDEAVAVWTRAQTPRCPSHFAI